MSIQTLLNPNPPPWLNIHANKLTVNTLDVGSNLEITGNLIVDGDATFDNDITVTNTIHGKDLTLTHDIACRDINPTGDIVVGGDVIVTGEMASGLSDCFGLARFQSNCQAFVGVTIGSSLTANHNLNYFNYTADGPATVNSSLQAANIKYNRCGKLVTVDVYESSLGVDGFTASVTGAMHILAAELTNIAPLLVADLAGRTIYFGAGLFTANPGGEYMPALIKLDPTGQINMYEPQTTNGNVSLGNKFLNFSFSFYSLA